MRKSALWIGAAAIALACSGGIDAQSTSRPSTGQQSGSDKQEGDTDRQSGTAGQLGAGNDHQSGNSITLIGCLERDGGAAGARGAGVDNTSTRAGDSAGERFTLNNVSQSKGRTSDSPGGAGSGAGASTIGSSAYTLEGKSDDLRKYVNQQVEVTGRVGNGNASSSRERDGARQSAGDSGEVVGRSGGNTRIRVESVRMVAASCSK